MRQIYDKKIIADYIDKSQFQSNFSFNVGPYVHLFQFDLSEHIMKEDSLVDYIFYMVKGKAKLYLTHSNGKISLIDFYKAPCFFGELELINVRTKAMAVQTITQCDCLALSIAQCKELLLNDAVFLKKLCIFLGTKSVINTAASTRSQAFPLQNRLASFILLTSQNSVYAEKHTEVAEYLGVSYRHLLYVLADFVKNGVLQKNSFGYRIINTNYLQDLMKEMDQQI
jgi:CRP-like cAMP-binding protein